MGIVTSLNNGIAIPQGQVIVRGRVEDIEGRAELFEIVTGEDTAEDTLRFPEVREKAQHRMPQVYKAWIVRQQAENTFAVAQNYIKRVEFRSPLIPKTLLLEFVPSS